MNLPRLDPALRRDRWCPTHLEWFRWPAVCLTCGGDGEPAISTDRIIGAPRTFT